MLMNPSQPSALSVIAPQRSLWQRLCNYSVISLMFCVLLGCQDEESALSSPEFPNEVVTLRVENVSSFTYDSLYAHVEASLNFSTARKLTTGPIAPESFTVIELPIGTYLSAVRELVSQGPKVAIRSQTPLRPSAEQQRLQLLDEGFILLP